MNIQQMTHIKNCRENLVGFLHFTDILNINELLKSDISQLNFYDICDLTISKYQKREISEKTASQVFEILMTENISFRTNKYRLDKNKLFEYSESHNAYLYVRTMSKQEFNLKSFGNIYI